MNSDEIKKAKALSEEVSKIPKSSKDTKPKQESKRVISKEKSKSVSNFAGIDLMKIKAGKDGERGKDGSPDTPEIIAYKLNTLENAIDSKVIIGFLTKEDIIAELKKGQYLEPKNIKGLPINMNDMRWHGGGLTNITGLITAGTNIIITGLGTTSSPFVINATGGGSLTSINADTTPAQILAVGSAGTDFAIVDNGVGIHTFNLPTASHTNRGALSSADWDTFNNKGSGTVISVSGTSNRITSTGGTTPVIDISATFEALLGKVANPLSQFASTTSAQLAGVISDETGTGALVFASAPALINPTATTQSAGDNSTKIATTAYVDNAILSTNYKEACKYGSVAALPSIIYANGSSGVGATLTGVALAAISLDGASPGVGDRVLIKNQVSTFQNGIYIVTQTGSGIAVFILTRAPDFDQAADIKTGDTVFITAGNTLANTLWSYTGIDSPTMGTDAITFVQVSADLIVGQSVILSGTTTRILYNNAGVLGEYTISGSGTVVAMAASPVFTTPALGTPVSGVMTNVTGLTEAGQTLADNTTNDVSTSKHGYAPKLPNDATKFLNGVGAYAVPAGGSYVPTFRESTIYETEGRFRATAGGGGTTTWGNNGVGVQLLTVSGADGVIAVQWAVLVEGQGSLFTPAFGSICRLITKGSDADVFIGLSTLGMRTLTGGNRIDYTISHAGFKITWASSGAGSLKATQSNGTTETASAELSAVAVNDRLELIAKMGASSVDYYWRINDGALSSATNLSANFPSGASIQYYTIMVGNANVDNANTMTFAMSFYERN